MTEAAAKETDSKKKWLLVVRDSEGAILKYLWHNNYDSLLMEGMDWAKELNGYWEIFNIKGIRIDGSFDLNQLKRLKQ